MPSVRAGWSPWNDFQAVPENLGNKRSFTQGDSQWTLSSSWHPKRERGKKMPYRMGNILGYDGELHKVRVYDDYIGHFAHENTDDPEYQRRLMYAMSGFENPDNVRSAEIDEGHISKVEYAIHEQVLRVTFATNGAVCLFFKIPASIAVTMITFAKTKATMYKNGKQRHKLGIAFWDWVRIRGCHSGAKYPFEYEKHVDGKFVKSGKRHTVSMTYGNAVKMFGKNSSIIKRLDASGHVADDNSEVKVAVVLNDEEYEKLAEFTGAELMRAESREFARRAGANGKDVSFEDIENFTGAYDSFEDDIIDRIAREQDIAAGRIKPTKQPMNAGKAPSEDVAAAYMTLADRAHRVLENRLENDRLSIESEKADVLRAMAESIYDTKESLGYKRIDPLMNDEQAFYNLYKKFGPQTMAKLLRIRGKGHLAAHITNADDPETIRRIIKEAFGKDTYDTWIKKNVPAKYASRYMGRLWTPQDLKDFANPTVPNGISFADSIPYKKLIAAKDWRAAFNFLKSHGNSVTYVDGNGVKHTLPRKKYASERDELAEED